MRLGVKNVDMLHGPLVPKLLTFALPMMLTNLLQMLYSAADMIVVAQSGVEGAVGAIGVTNFYVNLVVNVFIGFSVGANVIVAQQIGAGNRDKISSAVHTAILSGLFFGVLGGVIGYVLSAPMMRYMGAEGRVCKMAVSYCHIRFIGLPFLALTNFASAICRAKGDSQTPMVSLTLGGLINVLLNLFCVMVLGMNVEGVAWATVASNVFSTVVLLYVLSKDSGECRLIVKKLRIDRASLSSILKIGVPAGLQGALYSISNLLISHSLLTMNNLLDPGGSSVIDGNSAAQSIASLAITVSDGLLLSYTTFASQIYGAHDFKRLRKLIRVAYLLAAGTTATLCGLAYLFRNPLLSLYISDPKAYEVAHIRMDIMLTTYFISDAMSCGSNLLRGLGKSLTAAMITLVTTCVLRVVWIYTVFEHYMTLESIYFSYPVSWIIAALSQGVGLFLCYRGCVKKYNAEKKPAVRPV